MTYVVMADRPLSLTRPWWSEMAAIQTDMTEEVYRERLEGYLVYRKPKAIIALDDEGKVCGTTIWFGSKKIEGLPENAVVRSMVYTRPDMRGKGLAEEIRKQSYLAAAKDGFEYVISHSYETQAIYDWIATRPDAIKTEVICEVSGLPIHMFKLPEV